MKGGQQSSNLLELNTANDDNDSLKELMFSHVQQERMLAFIVVFVRFRLSDQLRSSADQINDFGVVNVADPETWVFRRLKYSHMCRL
ncbi:hypothetical protein MTR_1g098840 [Medicago truncatula]|uniref:Uncharacterized protein n=1 Tax=Medicago truncatula TaxID=3880 RepID=G7ICY7_MEDTR|nr:hypothetical protein MTR_1g098840 [Medicago truncatula]